MTDIVDNKSLIQQEEVRFQSSMSEGTLSRVGALSNFLANRELVQHDFNINGRYNSITVPFFFGDGYISYPFPFEIVDVFFYTGDVIGTSGITEVDVKWKPEASGSFQSIFSTTPKFNTGAPTNQFIRTGTSVAGMTAPVLSKTLFNAYDFLKLDMLQAISGPVNGVYVQIFTRPR